MHPNTEKLIQQMNDLAEKTADLTNYMRALGTQSERMTHSLDNCIYFIYDLIISHLPRRPENAVHGFWVNDAEEIMCKTRSEAETIADFFEALGVDCMHTYHYEEPSDPLSFWAVYVDGM